MSSVDRTDTGPVQDLAIYKCALQFCMGAYGDHFMLLDDHFLSLGLVEGKLLPLISIFEKTFRQFGAAHGTGFRYLQMCIAVLYGGREVLFRSGGCWMKMSFC